MVHLLDVFREGLCFLNKPQGTQNLPAYTFVAAEATAWIAANVEGIVNESDAVQLLQARLIACLEMESATLCSMS